MSEQINALPEADWRQRAKDKETAKPAMGIVRLAVVNGRLIEGNGDNEVMLKDGVTILPLAAIYARAYYSKPYDAKAKDVLPDCYSTSSSKDFVGVAPESNAPAIQAEGCDVCPLGSWDKAGWVPGQKAPKCGTRRNMIAKDLATGKVYRMSIPPTGVKAFDAHWSSLSGPLAGTLVKITADGKIPAFERKEDLTFEQFNRHAEPFIDEAEDLLRQPINYDLAKAAEGSEEPIIPGKPAPSAPKGKPRF